MKIMVKEIYGNFMYSSVEIEEKSGVLHLTVFSQGNWGDEPQPRRYDSIGGFCEAEVACEFTAHGDVSPMAETKLPNREIHPHDVI